jgi:hypothetical protein
MANFIHHLALFGRGETEFSLVDVDRYAVICYCYAVIKEGL